MLPRLLAQRAVRLRPHAMVERRRIYCPCVRCSSWNIVLSGFSPVGFVWGIMHLTYLPEKLSDSPSASVDSDQAGAPGIEITPRMVAAGIEAADLLFYRWGENAEGTL